MNKTELIKTIAAESGLSQAQAENAVNALCKVVIDELSQGGEVNIVGFGRFYVTERAERVGQNPKTKEPITIAATRVPKFKAGKTLKDATADV